MGTHRQGQTVVGAFVEDELKEYIDKLTAERGYLSRSDSLRAIFREHKSIFAKRNGRNQALTPEGVAVNGNHITEVKNE